MRIHIIFFVPVLLFMMSCSGGDAPATLRFMYAHAVVSPNEYAMTSVSVMDIRSEDITVYFSLSSEIRDESLMARSEAGQWLIGSVDASVSVPGGAVFFIDSGKRKQRLDISSRALHAWLQYWHHFPPVAADDDFLREVILPALKDAGIDA